MADKDTMSNKFVKHGILFTVVHFIVLVATGYVGTEAFLRGLEAGGEEGVTDRITLAAVEVLSLPGRLTWGAIKHITLPIGFEFALELILFLANSVLWGFAMASVVHLVQRPAKAPRT